MKFALTVQEMSSEQHENYRVVKYYVVFISVRLLDFV